MNTKITPIKFPSLLLTLFFAVSFGYGQTKLAEITFETPGGYLTSIPEFTNQATGNGQDYFIRTNGSNISSEIFSNIQGTYYFAAQDIDGEGAVLPVNLLINNINISGYSNLEFRVHLAEDDAGTNQDWDILDYVHFNYDLDSSGSFSPLLWIENDGSTYNSAPFIDANFDETGDSTEITDTFSQFAQSISGTGNLLDIQIEFSLDSGDEDIAIDNIEIWGTLIPCSSLVIWDGATSTWSNIVGPDITNEVQINGSYDSSIEGSFSACSLTVNSGASLTIADNTYVEVQNDLTVDGTIIVNPYGAFVQKNDFGDVNGDVLTDKTKIKVEKLTAPMNRWYEYTYWSSPVFQPEIGVALSFSDVHRRFKFDAKNYLDATMESNNNGATDPGSDGIDDNGDAWQPVSATDIMEPGIGYASTHDEAGFIIPFENPPYQFKYIFEGPFNNGVVTVPIYRNDSYKADDNLNFIGNPYPSAIDAQLFLDTNTNIAQDVEGISYEGNAYMDGAIYLWSQNTEPSSTANGNEDRNFSDSDYAIINGTGQTAGGDGVKPNRLIPSGQGFFISMSDTATPISTTVNSDGHTIAQGTVTFNNSMRVKGASDNSQFFKNSNTKSKSSTSSINKLWVNLTSNNGVFNQTLIGYVKGATNNYDGSYFDAEKNSSSKAAILYSTIDGLNKAFAIQGKSETSLNKDEIINLGFSTQIDVPTLYTLSIAKLQGDFLSNNTIYLLDNLTKTLHDLSTSDYTFTSDVGEFNDRFEIVFKTSSTLSTADVQLDDSTVKVSQVDNTHVNFKASNNLNIKTITIFDLLGRQLYQLKGSRNEETYKLPHLNQSIFIANIELSNGALVTKKAILK